MELKCLLMDRIAVEIFLLGSFNRLGGRASIAGICLEILSNMLNCNKIYKYIWIFLKGGVEKCENALKLKNFI